MKYSLKFSAYLKNKVFRLGRRRGTGKITGFYLFVQKEIPDDDDFDKCLEPYFQLEYEDGEIEYVHINDIKIDYEFTTKP